jgi:hypothetical protein
MLIDTDDSRLTARERTLLQQIAHRLERWRDYQPVPPLPPGYAQAIEETFGKACGSDAGDLEARGS